MYKISIGTCASFKSKITECEFEMEISINNKNSNAKVVENYYNTAHYVPFRCFRNSWRIGSKFSDFQLQIYLHRPSQSFSL